MNEGAGGGSEAQDDAGGHDKSGQTYMRLRSLLLDNRFPPSMQLSIQDIAEELGVSTTPVREALIRLAAEGLVASVANKGFHTRPLVLRDLLAEYELALVVLRFGVRNYGAMFSQNAIAAPSEAGSDDRGTKGASARTVRPLATFMEDVFERIVSLSANSGAIAIVRQFNDRVRYLRELDLQSPERSARLHSLTSDLVSQLNNEDLDAADASLVRLFDESVANLYELVKEANMRALSGDTG